MAWIQGRMPDLARRQALTVAGLGAHAATAMLVAAPPKYFTLGLNAREMSSAGNAEGDRE